MNSQYKKAGSAWNDPFNSDDSSLLPSDMGHAAGQAAHTPTPWSAFPLRTNDGRDGLSICGQDAKGNRNVPVCVLEESMWANGPTIAQVHTNAAFIVRACNSHAGLVEALEESVNQMQTMLLNSARYGFSNERINMTSAALVQARAALQSAKE